MSGPVIWLESTRVVHDDGSVDIIRDRRDTGERSERCSHCPYADSLNPTITAIEVVRTVRAGEEP